MTLTQRVIGIESSCDETAVAVYDTERGLLSHRLHSQIALHQAYGGVVPELASRDHVSRLLPLVREALAAAQSVPRTVDGVAYTAGPGLIGALLVGAGFASSLAYAWGKPAVGIHHLEGHLLAPLLEPEAPEFPFLALLVSGGHTQLVDVAGVGELSNPRADARRCGGGSLRQDGEDARIAVSGRCRARPAGRIRTNRPIQLSAAHARSGPGSTSVSVA